MSANALAIRCGHCKSTHPSVADVRSCAAGVEVPAHIRALAARTAALAAKGAARESLMRAKPMFVPTLDTDGYEPDAGRCGRCAGTGQFITGMVNGKPVGPGGICFRCAGKGVQVSCGVERHVYVAKHSACCDITRNASYDAWGIRI